MKNKNLIFNYILILIIYLNHFAFANDLDNILNYDSETIQLSQINDLSKNKDILIKNLPNIYESIKSKNFIQKLDSVIYSHNSLNMPYEVKQIKRDKIVFKSYFEDVYMNYEVHRFVWSDYTKDWFFGGKTFYKYDSLGRLVSRIVYGFINNKWVETNSELYKYFRSSNLYTEYEYSDSQDKYNKPYNYRKHTCIYDENYQLTSGDVYSWNVKNQDWNWLGTYHYFYSDTLLDSSKTQSPTSYFDLKSYKYNQDGTLDSAIEYNQFNRNIKLVIKHKYNNQKQLLEKTKYEIVKNVDSLIITEDIKYEYFDENSRKITSKYLNKESLKFNNGSEQFIDKLKDSTVHWFWDEKSQSGYIRLFLYNFDINGNNTKLNVYEKNINGKDTSDWFSGNTHNENLFDNKNRVIYSNRKRYYGEIYKNIYQINESYIKYDNYDNYFEGQSRASETSETLPIKTGLLRNSYDYNFDTTTVYYPMIFQREYPSGTFFSKLTKIESFVYDGNNLMKVNDKTFYYSPINPTSINIENIEEINIYPNPSSNIIKISNAQMYNQVEIYDVFGNLVNRIDINKNPTIEQNLESLANGIYTARFINQLNTQNQLFVIQK